MIREGASPPLRWLLPIFIRDLLSFLPRQTEPQTMGIDRSIATHRSIDAFAQMRYYRRYNLVNNKDSVYS